MLSSIKSKIWSSFRSRRFFSNSVGRHLWLKQKSIEFYDHIKLDNPESSRLLLKLFTDPDSYQLISQNSSTEEYLKKMLEHAKEKDRIKEVCLFLTQKFDSDFLTFNGIQGRFTQQFRFYWNYRILQEYAEAWSSESKLKFITGPKYFGKSFNFALFRNILCSNIKENRIIYIHNPEGLYETDNPFNWILDDLQFTFAHELKVDDREVYEAFDQCYRNLGEDKEVQFKSLKNLLSLSRKDGKKQVLMRDQQNVTSRYKIITTRGDDTPPRLARYVIADEIIRTILPQECYRVLSLASMTDEGFEKQSQNVSTYFAYQSLPENMSKIFIKDLFPNRIFNSEEVDTILEATRGIPGEITKFVNAKGENVFEKVSNYIEKRSAEIQSDFRAFLGKLSRVEESRSEAVMKMLSIYCDSNIALDVVPLDRRYDMRYIRIEGLRVKSLFPAVNRALKELYFSQDLTVKLMQKYYEDGNFKAVGILYDKFMKDLFSNATNTRKNIEMNIQDTKATADSKKFVLKSIKKEPLYSIDEIKLKELKQDTVYIPESEYFPDIDLIIYLLKENALLIIQFKYTQDLYKKWRYCEVPAKKKNPEKSDESTELNAPHEELSSTIESTELIHEEKRKTRLIDKSKLIEKFKSQVPNINIMFVLGFVKSNNDERFINKMLEDLKTTDIYLWHTAETEDLRSLNFERTKERRTKVKEETKRSPKNAQKATNKNPKKVNEKKRPTKGQDN